MKKLYVVLQASRGLAESLGLLERFERVQELIRKIKLDSAELNDLNKYMASPCFICEDRKAKNIMYDRNVKLTRRLQSYGVEIERLGFTLEPQDLA